jgi:2,3-bisphosphoglycerate-independent phosphoglycerate mutase
MKGILVILDGMGDLPDRQLNGKTPLEVAHTPNLDFLATRGQLGYMYPVKPGFVPESDEAIVSIFRNELISSTRGQLEAVGARIKMTRGDLALRVNFATIDSIENKNILDRRAGRTLTTAEAKILAKSLNKIKLPCEFIFEPTIQHRAVLVFRGGFSDNFMGNDPDPFTGKFRLCKTSDDEENCQYTVNVLNEFLEKAHEVLNKHPVNQERRKKGLFPANYLLVRSPGIESPKVKSYKKWVSPSYMPVEKGFSQVSGMKVFSFEYPKLKKLDVYLNLWEGLKKACHFSIKILKKLHKKFDYMYIHLKETDVAGHDNKPIEKKLMLEYIDKTLFNFLRKFAPPRKINIVITADHSTPCKFKKHSADPVPVLFYNNSIPKEKKFSEKECRKGSLGGIMGKELLKKVGFTK